MNITITIDGTDPKKAFEAGAFWREYNRYASKCGKCGSTNTMPVHRTATAKSGPNAGKKSEHYEAVCCDCGATFGFGQKQDDKSLFPGKKNQQTGQFEKVWREPFKGDGSSYNSVADSDSQEPPF
jgi:hypothetical protein